MSSSQRCTCPNWKRKYRHCFIKLRTAWTPSKRTPHHIAYQVNRLSKYVSHAGQITYLRSWQISIGEYADYGSYKLAVLDAPIHAVPQGKLLSLDSRRDHPVLSTMLRPICGARGVIRRCGEGCRDPYRNFRPVGSEGGSDRMFVRPVCSCSRESITNVNSRTPLTQASKYLGFVDRHSVEKEAMSPRDKGGAELPDARDYHAR